MVRSLGLLLLIFLASPLRGQEAGVSMKIDLVAWGDSIRGLSLDSAGKRTDITAHSFTYSTPVSYSGPAILEIHQSGSGSRSSKEKVSQEDKDHEMSPLVAEEPKTSSENQGKAKQGLALELEKRRKEKPGLVALAALPGGACRRATVLLAPAAGGTYTAYVIDDDPSKLPPGQLRVHNLSPLIVAMRCSRETGKELKTRDSFLVPSQNGQVIYELAYKHGDEWKVQENNIIPIRATEQTQMLILKSDNSFFLSTDGSSGGFLQIVTLRRSPKQQTAGVTAQ